MRISSLFRLIHLYSYQLSTCRFTIEFGITRQHGELKAYGAGLLSSFGELEWCLSGDQEQDTTRTDHHLSTHDPGKPELQSFDPEKTGVTKYPITQHQPLYFVTESFEDAKQKMM